MVKPNMFYADLKDSYLFYNIAQKTKAYLQENPEQHLYRMGIGDVSLPLCPAVIPPPAALCEVLTRRYSSSSSVYALNLGTL